MFSSLRLGIAAKLALSLVSLLLVATLVIGMLVYRHAERELVSSSTKRLDHIADIVNLRLENEIVTIREDVRFLASLPVVDRVITAADTSASAPDVATSRAADRRIVQSVFSALLQQHPNYFQVRLISRMDGGREVVRVVRKDGDIMVAPSDSLQQKGTRTYFREAATLPPGEVYVSEVNLNREYGVIEQPEMPAIRLAVPLYGQTGEVLGIVVINVNIDYIRRQLRALVPGPMSFYLTNSEGDFLAHPDSAKTFGFERGRPFRIEQEFPELARFLQGGDEVEGLVRVEPEVLYVKRFLIDRGVGTDFLLLAVAASQEFVFAGVREVQRSTMYVMLLFCLLSVGLAFGFAYLLTRPIRHIRRAVEAFGQDAQDGTHELPIQRTDEIGMLARTFAEMRGSLSTQMEELVKARTSAEEASRMKSTFLANMSHEIRTPLTILIGFGDLLATELEGEEQRLAQEIVRGGQRLMETLTSVLTLAQLEARGMRLEPQAVAVAEEVGEIASLFSWEAQRKGIDLSVEVEPEARGARAFVDKGGLSSVLQNLIGNAIKFTEVGRVTVTVARGSTVGADDAPVEADVLIHVADTGIGISEAFQERLFESFTQESTGHGRSYEGSGLGLSIAKQLTEKMGGEISVESEKGEGSRFTLRFPLADGSEASAGPQRGEARRAEVTVDGTRKRVLVVGDHAEMRTLIQRLLEATYDIAAVGNAKAAVALARETDADARPFAAVLVDVDGGSETSYLEVVRRLRALPAYERVPIAAVTADALPDDRERLLAEGYSTCLEKPFLPEELKELVSRLVAEETEG